MMFFYLILIWQVEIIKLVMIFQLQKTWWNLIVNK